MAAELGDPYSLEVVGAMTEMLGNADMDLMIASASQGDEVRTYERMIEKRRIDDVVVARTKWKPVLKAGNSDGPCI